MVDFRIDVIVDPRRAPKGLRAVEKGLTRVQNRADAVRGSLGSLFRFVAFGAAIRQLVLLTNQFVELENRIRFVTSSEAELVAVTSELFKVSQETRGSFKATALIYARLALTSTELGRSQAELIRFTKSLNQAIILSGASAVEARNAIIQLSQGLASGALRGDELRSVLEQLPFVARLIAKELGTSLGGKEFEALSEGAIGKLRELGAEGKITADIVFNALGNAAEELDTAFAQTIPTIGQAFQVVSNSILEFVGTSDKAVGISEFLARSLIILAQNIEQFARGAIAAGTALAVAFVSRGINAAIAGLARLAVAIFANPLTAIPAVIALAIGALIGFGDQVAASSEGIATISDVAVETFKTIFAAVQEAGKQFEEFASSIGIDFEFSFRGILDFAARTTDGMVGFFVGAFNVIGVLFDSLGPSAKVGGQLILKGFRDGLEAVLDFVLAVVTTIGNVLRRTFTNINNAIAASAGALGSLLSGSLEAATQQADNAANAVKLIALGIKDIPAEVAGVQAKLQGVELLPVVEISRDARDLGKIVANEFQRGFTETTGAQDLVGGIFDRAERRAVERADREKREAAEREAARLGLGEGGGGNADDARKFSEANIKAVDALLKRVNLTRDLAEQQDILRQRFVDGEIDLQQFGRAFEELELKSLEASNTMEAGFERAFIKIRQEAEDLASVAEDIVNLFADAATDAITEFARTGQLEIKAFASAVLDDLARIITRLLVVQAISAFLPASTAAAPPLPPFGLQHGGTTQPNRSFVVGEAGPELFTPGRTGEVTPAATAQEPPQVNVQVVNVDDPEMVPDALNSGAADEAILNILARNKQRVSQVIR
jgi:tape measure domain-containing protein